MTDRELLELAAKAAGIDGDHTIRETGTWVFFEPRKPNWNPLADDGDALRLAVRMGFLVDTNGMHARVSFPYEEPLAHEPMTDDRNAATRRAIVRAAAEIGKALK